MSHISRRLDIAHAPTTPAQRRDWNAHHARADSSFLHLAAAFAIEGPADDSILAAAVDRLVERHEALRTWFDDSGGTLVQAIAPASWSNSPRLEVCTEQTAGTAKSWLADFVGRPFDLSAEAPFRVGLLIGDDGGRTLALVAHHIVSDQLSLGVAVRDLSELITAQTERRCSELPDLAVQFADYATWFDGRLADGGFARNFDFWQRQLDDAPTSTHLPVRAAPSMAAVEFVQPIGGPAAAELLPCAAQLGTTPYVVLLSAFSAALSGLTGCEDQVFQCGYANRRSSALRHGVGRFSNNMALRIHGSGAQDATAHVRATHAVAMQTYANAVVSLDAVNEAGVLRQQYTPNPSNAVAFQLVDGVGELLRIPGCSVRPVPTEPSAIKDLLNVAVERNGQELTLHAVYNPMALDPGWIRSLAGAFTDQLDRLMTGSPA